MPEEPSLKIPPPDPEKDIRLCRIPPSPHSFGIPDEDDTEIFAHPVPEGPPLFYLRYLDEYSGRQIICPFASNMDAAAFITGLAGIGLRKIPEPDQVRIRAFFPGWFDCEDVEHDDPVNLASKDSCSPVQCHHAGDKSPMCPEILAGPSGNAPIPEKSSGQLLIPDTAGPPSSKSPDCTCRNSPSPALDVESAVILYRSLRYNLHNGERNDRGMDLCATRDEKGASIFWFRHWTAKQDETPIRKITSRKEAAGFIRDQFSQPGLFSGWNHKDLHEFLPEVYGKK
ncbi:hypothetical protein [Methanoregula sp.]|uniref:hypothetical protein n=1 Tax=Methanoregula sp. TaxID=2052170 RepID=UPI00356569F9